MNTSKPTRRARPFQAVGGRRAAFTLVELLVVIAIIGMLMALLVPAVQMAREAGRRATCMNNQKQLGTAVMNYVTAKDKFPPAFDLQPGTATNVHTWVGWVPALLPYIEQNQYYQAYQIDGWGTLPNATISTLICPSRNATGTPAPLSYIVNCGAPDVKFSDLPTSGTIPPMDWQENGVFFDWFTPKWARATAKPNIPPTVTTDISWINKHDGNAMTLLLSESLDALDWIRLPMTPNAALPNTINNADKIDGLSWWQGCTWDIPVGSSPPEAPFVSNNMVGTMNVSTGLNITAILNRNAGLQVTYSSANATATGLTPSLTAELAFARPSSNHSSGFLVTMCDGHTQFLSQDIDYRIYYLLMTPDSATTKIPGKPVAAANISPRPSTALSPDDLNK